MKMNNILKKCVVLIIVITATTICLTVPVPMGFIYGGPLFILGGFIYGDE